MSKLTMAKYNNRRRPPLTTDSDSNTTEPFTLDKLTLSRGLGQASKNNYTIPKKLLFQQDERLSHELAVQRRKKKTETNDTVESDRHK